MFLPYEMSNCGTKQYISTLNDSNVRVLAALQIWVWFCSHLKFACIPGASLQSAVFYFIKQG